MKVKLETMTVKDGAHAGTQEHDLVLTQCGQTIRIGLIADDAQQALQELITWLEDNTMDLVEIMADRPAAQQGQVPV